MAKNAKQFEERPWGTFEVIHEFKLADGSDVIVKKLIVWPQKRLSYQSHKYRSEHWHIVEGEGLVVIDDQEIPVAAGHKIHVPLEAKHRIINNHPDQKLIIIEIGLGEFDEFDNTRYQDDFGRE